MNNKDIREEIKKAKLFQWQIAENIGVNESAFSRKLRYELPTEEKQEIFSVIQKLKERGN